MKKVFTFALVLFVMFSVSVFVVACSSEKAGSTVVSKLLDVASAGADEFVKEVDSATADDVEDLRNEGSELLESLDETVEDLSTETDLSEEDKTELTDKIESIRQKIVDAMAKLESK